MNNEKDNVLVDVAVINQVTSRVVWLLIGMVVALVMFMAWQMWKPAAAAENNFMSEFVGLFSSVITYLVGLVTGMVARWSGSQEAVAQQQQTLQKNVEANRKQVHENQMDLLGELSDDEKSKPFNDEE